MDTQIHHRLYNPADQRDSCGFGLVAHIGGVPDHQHIDIALESLRRMTHRGAVSADGVTGDGCGLSMQKPDDFLRAEALRLFNAELSSCYAVGTFFLDSEHAITQRQQIATVVTQYDDLKVVGWREVPIAPHYCGTVALKYLPRVEQLFIDAPHMDNHSLNTWCYTVRQKMTQQVTSGEFYICQLSATMLLYKALVMPKDLANFYPDLQNQQLKSALCMFHQRFSTNTLPRWSMAQPFRMLAHNGEFNTILGNRNWSVARQSKFAAPNLPPIKELLPLVNREGSDSSSLDNMLELFVAGGMDIFRALRLLIPPAWENRPDMDDNLRAFYEYNSMHMEPWDGPAGLVISDGRYAICAMDRNGLRPARYTLTADDIITVASESGTRNCDIEQVVEKGRVGPGQILAVDTEYGKLLHSEDIDTLLKNSHPYRKWLGRHQVSIGADNNDALVDPVDIDLLPTYMKQFQVTIEEYEQMLIPMAETGAEPIGSMGDDTPMPVLSQKNRPLYDSFRQQFAQVTNPPIDSLRERLVMTLSTCLGAEHNVFEETEMHATRITISSPILSPDTFHQLLNTDTQGFPHEIIPCIYDPKEKSLLEALEDIEAQALRAVKKGVMLICLSDRAIEKGKVPVHSLLAVGAVHHFFIKKGVRCDANIIAISASARNPHHIACLIGFGATAVYPYLGYQLLVEQIANHTNPKKQKDIGTIQKNYRQSLDKGLLKILSKMGIATVASYRGAQLFDPMGIDNSVIDHCFHGLNNPIGGMTFAHIEADFRKITKHAWQSFTPIESGGVFKFMHRGEYHAFNPQLVKDLHKMVRSGNRNDYQQYKNTVYNRPVTVLRDLLTLRQDMPAIPLAEVEECASMFSRFDSAGMSLGALSPEAHEALAMAMNSLNGHSNSGEGGEDERRFNTPRNSSIKQIASGRFGVTPYYLVNAHILQIKIAQGAKPGEGGQLPGHKVTPLIAKLRYSTPGVTLISPPPHHDIYSIEDLAQLIFDLKQVHPSALVSVKLVSERGIGTIAVGVAKAHADLITISGYDGGTAASPLTSIHYAGLPWELGLAEVHQALRHNGLRGAVRLQVDGGMKTGLDVIKAAILGAESFGFGTAPMIALGCKYLRICHLNNCATGVATQDAKLRDNHFVGTVEMIRNFFISLGEEVRSILSSLGVKSIADLIGRTDLLIPRPGESARQQNIDLMPLLFNDPSLKDAPQYCTTLRNIPWHSTEVTDQMVADILPAIKGKTGGEFCYRVHNNDRSIGARLSGEIARLYGNHGMENYPITLSLIGSCGQSFGAWNAGGLNMHVAGEANDYVGKGMAGGRLVLAPPPNSSFQSHRSPIIGNTCLYGATGGELYAAGQAGERFAVRNSGAIAVIEGAGDHCCEYMTGGCVVVLNGTGYNFGAGMTGGFAFVAHDGDFSHYINAGLVRHTPLIESDGRFIQTLHTLLDIFVQHTQSQWGQSLLTNYPTAQKSFWLITPTGQSIDTTWNNFLQLRQPVVVQMNDHVAIANV